MSYNPDAYPFDSNNRAWQRFTDIVGEHLDVVTWTRDSDGRPVMTTLTDIASGDAFTLGIFESSEMREPFALLAFNASRDLVAHGPFAGEHSAANHAPHLAISDPEVTATRPVPLHHPTGTELGDDVWRTIPRELADVARAGIASSPAAVLVLLDCAGGALAAIGPFTSYDAAADWPAPPSVDAVIGRLVIPLHAVEHGPDST